MARWVLLAFEDDAVAKSFVALVQKGVEDWHGESMEDAASAGVLAVSSSTVDGVFGKPTKFCDCSNKKSGWRRGQKHGWWIHANCGRPSKPYGTSISAVIGSAINLLKEKSDGKETDKDNHCKVESRVSPE